MHNAKSPWPLNIVLSRKIFIVPRFLQLATYLLHGASNFDLAVFLGGLGGGFSVSVHAHAVTHTHTHTYSHSQSSYCVCGRGWHVLCCVVCEVRAEAEEIVNVTCTVCVSCELKLKEHRVTDIRAT